MPHYWKRQTPRPVGAKLSKEASTLACLETVEKDHGRVETRRYYQSDRLDWFADRAKWEGLKSVGMVESIREVEGQTTAERRYFLCSLPWAWSALPGGAQPLGDGEPAPLDYGRVFW